MANIPNQQPTNTSRSTTHEKNTIKVEALNVNFIGTNKRRYDLQTFLQFHKFDILLLSETKLNKIHKPLFENYTLIRTDRANNKRGGGTAILIANNISFTAISYPNSRDNTTLELTVIKVHLQNNNPVLIFSVYAPLKSCSTFIEELEKLFTDFNLHNSNNRYIIADDINARNTDWGDISSNLRGN